jgi:hypothetical protein
MPLGSHSSEETQVCLRLQQELSPDRSSERLTSKFAPPLFPTHSFFMLPDEQPSPEQVEILRAIPGEQRLRLAERLYGSARKMKAAGLRAQHPD